MSYIRTVGNIAVFVDCVADPETNYKCYYKELENAIKRAGYTPETGMDHLISMVVLAFDCDDNYGEYDPSSGFGGYGEEFTIEQCLQYVEDSGGWKEFDYYC